MFKYSLSSLFFWTLSILLILGYFVEVRRNERINRELNKANDKITALTIEAKQLTEQLESINKQSKTIIDDYRKKEEAREQARKEAIERINNVQNEWPKTYVPKRADE